MRREGEDGVNKYSLFRSLSPDHELQRERKSIGGMLEGKAGRKGGRGVPAGDSPSSTN